MPQKILRTLDEQIQPEHTALLIINPQNDFCSQEGAIVRLMGWDVSRIQRAVDRLNQFIKRAREEHMMIVWTRSLVDPDMAKPSFKSRSFINVAEARSIELVKNADSGSDWYSGIIRPSPEEYVITKYHYDAFEDTNVELLLGSRGIKTLLLTGFITNVCVETCARHGYIKGYYIVVVADCTDGATQQEFESTLFNIKTYFGKVVTSKEIERIWETPPK